MLQISAESGVDDGLDGVHAVLCLVKDHGLAGLEDFVGDLHLRYAKLLRDLGADGGLGVVEGGEAVHEEGLRLGLPHHIGVDR